MLYNDDFIKQLDNNSTTQFNPQFDNNKNKENFYSDNWNARPNGNEIKNFNLIQSNKYNKMFLFKQSPDSEHDCDFDETSTKSCKKKRKYCEISGESLNGSNNSNKVKLYKYY